MRPGTKNAGLQLILGITSPGEKNQSKFLIELVFLVKTSSRVKHTTLADVSVW